MPFIPTHCDHCHTPALLDIEELRDERATCSRCGGRPRVVPAACFVEHDLALYTQLSDAIRQANISGSIAPKLADDLCLAGIRAPEEVLPRIARVSPVVASAFIAVERQPAARRKLEAMLCAILKGIATARP